MFEKFTEKAVNVIVEAQNIASYDHPDKVLAEHLLLALVKETKGFVAKIFKTYDITYERLAEEIYLSLNIEESDMNSAIPFSEDFKRILTNTMDLIEKSGNPTVHYEHLVLAAINDKYSKIREYLEHLDFDIEKSKPLIEKLVQRKAKKDFHPETDEIFEEKLSHIDSRQAEYEGRQIVFTPNAFIAMSLALQTAKELGSSEVLPEHMILGLLKTKKGVAYNIFKELNINDDDLAHGIIKPIEKQMPETLTILRLAKQEARRIGRGVVGTEMFLLGIIGEATGIGAVVLNELEINIRDARIIIEQIIGYGNEYFENEMVFTKRAKRVLETAWEYAKKQNKTKIESSDLLYAITTEPDSLAMQALEQLGTDVVEIREGIKKHIAKAQ